MDEKWFGVSVVVFVCLLCQNLCLCWSLNEEGLALLKLRERIVSDPFGALRDWNDDDGDIDPCSWFGVECSEGKVVVLNLKDLCLKGSLVPELKNLVHIKSIILRNNSFDGMIPKEIGELKELELLDLGYNNFIGPLPPKIGNNLSLAILLLDNNELLASLSPEEHKLKLLSEIQVDENQLSIASKRLSDNTRSITRKGSQAEATTYRRLLYFGPFLKAISNRRAELLAGTSPSPSSLPSPSPSPMPSLSPTIVKPSSPPVTGSPTSSPNQDSPPMHSKSQSSRHRTVILVGIIGGCLFLFVSIIGIFFFRNSKVTTVKPWATGLSGQLQKAFVTGVPKLKRLELETACEDFSNIVGSSSIGTVYKGTLSSGVEIAVISIAVKSTTDWSKNLEEHFRNKIDTLSKMNHKNFVNLLGYCEEEEPFTRMMVFEYAPNGTLFEHLHIKESEHLDWEMRMRITMGIAYCLEHMHKLTPLMSHKNLNSSAVNLSDDYAAKISEFNFWNDTAASEIGYAGMELWNTKPALPKNNVYNFGVLLFEIVTGRLPYSVDDSSIEDWASHYLRREESLKEMVDPTLEFFQQEQLDRIGEVITSCVHPDLQQRPSMTEVVAQLRNITGITLDGAIPKLSPLWWAELEILSTNAV